MRFRDSSTHSSPLLLARTHAHPIDPIYRSNRANSRSLNLNSSLQTIYHIRTMTGTSSSSSTTTEKRLFFEQQAGSAYGYRAAIDLDKPHHTPSTTYPDGATGLNHLRQQHFQRLGDAVYLDHAGASLYSELQLDAAHRILRSQLFGNPRTTLSRERLSYATLNLSLTGLIGHHRSITDSQSDSSSRSSESIVQARKMIMRHFGIVDHTAWSIVFTYNASAAIKLVGESFPFHNGGSLHYTMSNHTSVLGIRGYV